MCECEDKDAGYKAKLQVCSIKLDEISMSTDLPIV